MVLFFIVVEQATCISYLVGLSNFWKAHNDEEIF